MTVRLFLTILNGGICILGDYLVDVNQKSPILMAIYDNLTHAIVGYLGTFVIIFSTVHRTNAIERIYLVGLGTLLSSLIDIDHFIVGRTFKLSEAIRINQRPFFHFTIIPIVVMLLMVQTFYLFRSFRWNLWLCVVACAFFMHHTRDATRRGFTLWPFGTTKPLPYAVYIFTIMMIPFVMVKWLNVTTSIGEKHQYPVDILTI